MWPSKHGILRNLLIRSSRYPFLPGIRRGIIGGQTGVSSWWITCASVHQRSGECSCHESDSHSCAKVTHSGLEVHRSSSIEQQSCNVDVPVMSGDVQRRETALKTGDGKQNQRATENWTLAGPKRDEKAERKPNMRRNVTSHLLPSNQKEEVNMQVKPRLITINCLFLFCSGCNWWFRCWNEFSVLMFWTQKNSFKSKSKNKTMSWEKWGAVSPDAPSPPLMSDPRSVITKESGLVHH